MPTPARENIKLPEIFVQQSHFYRYLVISPSDPEEDLTKLSPSKIGKALKQRGINQYTTWKKTEKQQKYSDKCWQSNRFQSNFKY